VLGGLAAQRFMFPNALAEPDPTVQLGEMRSYAELPVGTIDETHRDQGLWIARLPGRIAAISTRCTHLGCLTQWFKDERRFKCPCHGSSFDPEGLNLDGPAPRALDRLKIWAEDGIVVVDRSRKFQRERGEWSDPDSFLAV
jgi:cytochrome b6-f complex iron-sulfur subunit